MGDEETDRLVRHPPRHGDWAATEREFAQRGPRPSACTGSSMRENREIPQRPPARDGVPGRIGEAEP